jgi:hypothetical protein
LAQDSYDVKIYLQGYQKYCQHFWRPEEARSYSMDGFRGFNSGAFITGKGGCGKSGILTYVVAWAHENKWVVISVPRGRYWTSHHGEPEADNENVPAILERHSNGLYLHPERSREFLEDIAYSNEQSFREMKVNKSIYGKFDMTGVHDKDGEPFPRTWDNKRKVWSDSWKQNLSPAELMHYDQMLPIYT